MSLSRGSKPKKIDWRLDWGCYVPFCPYCDELSYDRKKCLHCGKEYEWVEPKYKPKKVYREGYTIIQTTNMHIHIYDKADIMVFHGSCKKPQSKKELLQIFNLYKKTIT